MTGILSLITLSPLAGKLTALLVQLFSQVTWSTVARALTP